MALAFPRDMPTAGIATQHFDPPRIDFISPETGGRIGAVTAGFPLWKAEFKLGAMSRAEADAWRAFLRSLRGSQRTFYAYDLLRQYPAAYPAGFGGLLRAGGGALPADGAPTAWGVNGTRDVLTLNGMPANFVIGHGDLVGFSWVTETFARRTLAASVEAVVGSAGGVAAFTIEPALPSLVPVGASVSLYRPTLIMRLPPGGSEMGAEDTVSTDGGRILAIQDLRE